MELFNELVVWMCEPGKWNDAVVLCAVVGVTCFGLMIKYNK